MPWRGERASYHESFRPARPAVLHVRHLAAYSVLVLLLAGCFHAPTTSTERSASFAPFVEERIDGRPLRDFIADRTALLVGGMSTDALCSHAFASLSTAIKSVHGRYALGTATAVDARGYLLTAAHCVEWQPLHALYLDAGHVRVAPVRIVWRGDATREGCDMALLAIDRPLPAHFAWADEIKTGNVVVGAGPDYDAPAFGLGFFSGTAVKLEPNSTRPPAGATIFHTGPVHLGDSGGPLATTNGELLAINVGDIHELNLLLFSYQRASRAHRPDLPWLRDLVDRDFAANPPRSSIAD